MIKSLRGRAPVSFDLMKQTGPRFHRGAEFQQRSGGIRGVQRSPLMWHVDPPNWKPSGLKMRGGKVKVFLRQNAHADAPAAAAKAKPNSLNIATAGVGTGQQMTAVAFMKETGTQMSQVPYKGATAVYPDLLAGRVDDAFFDSTTAALPYVKAGKVKALGLIAAHRSKDAPDVPTMGEAGIPGLDIEAWIGIFALAGTPKPVIEKLQMDIFAAIPEMAPRFGAVGGRRR